MRYLIPLFAVFLLLSLAPVNAPLLACDDWNTLEEKYSREFALEPGGKLTLENAIGEIEITGWDQPRVEVVAIKKVRYGDNRERAKALLKEMIEARQKGNSIKIESDLPDNFDLGDGWTLSKLIRLGKIVQEEKLAGIFFRIKVPHRTDIRVEQSVGELRVEGIEGEVNVENSVGELILVNLSGEVDAETSVGEITLRLPADAGADIRASCNIGEIDCDLPLETRQRLFGKSLKGKLNGGGKRISLETVVGEINLEESK